jgi:GNAT superfamily N-acetyltransferase
VLSAVAIAGPDRTFGRVSIELTWRGPFENGEVNALHATAFHTRRHGDEEWNWRELVERHSLGWVVARDGVGLAGFANVVWDGFVHAWIQDVMVDDRVGRQGVGTAIVAACADGARAAGCEILHVDFEEDLAAFYIEACGFTASRAGLLYLTAGS